MSSLNLPENIRDFDKVIRKLRSFFDSRGFIEVHAQHQPSILAACEDPRTVSIFNWQDTTYALPQTSQVWLEVFLLEHEKTHPSIPLEGIYTVSTSYRNEPNPIPGRHELIFPMFEFEMRGTMKDLLKMEQDLVAHLGYAPGVVKPYIDVAREYGVKELTHDHETRLQKDYGDVVFLTDFPKYTNPYFNMRAKDTENNVNNDDEKALYNKIDVILSGVETIGSAERSISPEQMLSDFHILSDGEYAKLLYSKFTKERVDKELDDFLKLPFIERCGGGIGVTRLISSMKSKGLL